MRRSTLPMVALVLLLTACGHQSHVIHGLLLQTDGYFPSGGATVEDATNQSTCNAGGNPAVGIPARDFAGDQVIVKNASGTIVGTATLGTGHVHLTGGTFTDPLTNQPGKNGECIWAFTVTVADSGFYTISIPAVKQQGILFSKSDLEARGWRATLTWSSSAGTIFA